MAALVDTSVWSLLLLRQQHAPSHEKALLLKKMLDANETIFVMGLIVQELLQGVRKREQFDKLAGFFNAFSLVNLTYGIHIAAAELHRLCRSKGLQLGTIDCLIAAAAIEQQVPLLTADNDFLRVSQISALQLL